MIINPQTLQTLGMSEADVFVNGERMTMVESINTETQTAYMYEVGEDGKIMTNSRGSVLLSSFVFVYAEVISGNMKLAIGDFDKFNQLVQEQIQRQHDEAEGTDPVPLGEPEGEEGVDGVPIVDEGIPPKSEQEDERA